MSEKLLDLVLRDELSWEYLILDVVKEEGINPEDIDIVRLTNSYLSKVRELEDLNFVLSGKVLLVAAILLRFKVQKLFSESNEVVEEVVVDLSVSDLLKEIDVGEVSLEPIIPLPKKRKVTLEELMSALNSALKVEKRRVARVESRKKLRQGGDFKLRLREFVLSDKIEELKSKLFGFFNKLGRRFVLFSEIRPSSDRFDTVWTFLPLLHLSNKGVVELKQDVLFEDFRIEFVGGDER